MSNSASWLTIRVSWLTLSAFVVARLAGQRVDLDDARACPSPASGTRTPRPAGSRAPAPRRRATPRSTVSAWSGFRSFARSCADDRRRPLLGGDDQRLVRGEGRRVGDLGPGAGRRSRARRGPRVPVTPSMYSSSRTSSTQCSRTSTPNDGGALAGRRRPGSRCRASSRSARRRRSPGPCTGASGRRRSAPCRRRATAARRAAGSRSRTTSSGFGRWSRPPMPGPSAPVFFSSARRRSSSNGQARLEAVDPGLPQRDVHGANSTPRVSAGG